MTTSDELRDIAQWIPSHLAAKVLQIADGLEAAPVAPALVPLTDERIVQEADSIDTENAFIAGFVSGARFAEYHHGIK